MAQDGMVYDVPARNGTPHMGTTHAGAAPSDVIAAVHLLERLRRAAARLLPVQSHDALILVQAEAWKQFGFANAQDFARERLDHSGRWLKNLAKLGAAFAQWPILADAASGEDGRPPLSRAAAFEVARVSTTTTRVARSECVDTATTVQSWIAMARHSTVRRLKDLIASHTDSVEPVRSSESASSPPEPEPNPAFDCAGMKQAHLSVVVPTYVARAFEELERAFFASNPGHVRGDFLDALCAEYQSASPNAVGHANGVDRFSGPTGATRDEATISILGDEWPGASIGPIAIHEMDDSEDEPEYSLERWESTNSIIGLSRWTLQRAAQYKSSHPGNTEGTRAEVGFTRLCDAMQLEREIETRVAQLLLWLDNRNAWVYMGTRNALQYGESALGQSAGTTRNQLRLARALVRSTVLRKSYDSGRLSQQRVIRLSRLAERCRLGEEAVARWAEHAETITIKRLDDELRVVNVREATGAVFEPQPLSDQEWFASLRLALGAARDGLLRGSLQALAARPPANVFLRLSAATETITALRVCLQLSRNDLTIRALAPDTAPATEARQHPSIRLARIWHSRQAWFSHPSRFCGQTRLPDWLCLVAVLEEFAEEWDNPHRATPRPTDTITTRNGWRCTAPGCTARVLEVHHIVYQSQGGTDDPSNLTSLCPFHHRMGEHGTLASVTGAAPLGLRWQLGAEGMATSWTCERSVVE